MLTQIVRHSAYSRRTALSSSVVSAYSALAVVSVAVISKRSLGLRRALCGLSLPYRLSLRGGRRACGATLYGSCILNPARRLSRPCGLCRLNGRRAARNGDIGCGYLSALCCSVRLSGPCIAGTARASAREQYTLQLLRSLCLCHCGG